MKSTARRSLFALFLAVVCSSGAAADDAFESRESLELPEGVRVEIDGTGRIRARLEDRVLFEATQALVYGRDDFARVTPLAHEARPRHAGDTFAVDQEEVGLPETELISRVHAWRYFHVNDIAFIDSSLDSQDSEARLPARPGLMVDAPEGLQWIDREARIHCADGTTRRQKFRIAVTTIDREDGSRLLVGLVRLDAASAEMIENGVVWATEQQAWPLAVIATRSERSLLYLAGQARLTFDPASHRKGEEKSDGEHWRIPPLCARCQSPRLGRLAVEFSDAEGMIEIDARIRGGNQHGQIDLEALSLAGHEIGRYYEGTGRRGRAVFRLPKDADVTRSLIAAATTGSLPAQTRTTANEIVVAETVDVEVSPRLLDADADETSEYEQEELPAYLSSKLVRAWPNPFESTTTVEITIPARIGEAFDLEGTLAQRVNPDDPPPFGDHPLVSVKVFNAQGQLVRELEQGEFGPGSISVNWDGQDLRGRNVASGAYYVHVRMGDWSVTQRVLRLGG